MSVRFGIVGLGMGMNRSRQVLSTDGAELVAVCDLDAVAVGESASYRDTSALTVEDDVDARRASLGILDHGFARQEHCV